MSKRSRIRWRESDKAEIAKAVRKYNAKITRVVKKDPNMADYVPKRVTTKEIRENIESRRDLKNILNSLERFSRKGSEELMSSEYGLVTTKYDVQEARIKVQTINRERTKRRTELEQLEATSRGKPIGMKRGEMGSVRLNAYNPMKFNFAKKKPEEWEHFKRGLEKQLGAKYRQERDALLKQNYIKALHTVFGEDADIIKLADHITHMETDDFINTYYSDQEAEIEFLYEELLMAAKKNALMEVFKVNKNDRRITKAAKEHYKVD